MTLSDPILLVARLIALRGGSCWLARLRVIDLALWGWTWLCGFGLARLSFYFPVADCTNPDICAMDWDQGNEATVAEIEPDGRRTLSTRIRKRWKG